SPGRRRSVPLSPPRVRRSAGRGCCLNFYSPLLVDSSSGGANRAALAGNIERWAACAFPPQILSAWCRPSGSSPTPSLSVVLTDETSSVEHRVLIVSLRPLTR